MSYLFKEEKTIIILFILTIIALICVRLNDSDSTSLVFSSVDYEYNTYIIDVSDDYVTTHNLNEIAIEIEEVLPFINEKYDKIIQTNWYNFDKTLNYEKNINNLENLYKSIFLNNALSKEALELEYNGLRISKIKLITNDISKFSNYKYKKLNFE